MYVHKTHRLYIEVHHSSSVSTNDNMLLQYSFNITTLLLL